MVNKKYINNVTGHLYISMLSKAILENRHSYFNFFLYLQQNHEIRPGKEQAGSTTVLFNAKKYTVYSYSEVFKKLDPFLDFQLNKNISELLIIQVGNKGWVAWKEC